MSHALWPAGGGSQLGGRSSSGSATSSSMNPASFQRMSLSSPTVWPAVGAARSRRLGLPVLARATSTVVAPPPPRGRPPRPEPPTSPSMATLSAPAGESATSSAANSRSSSPSPSARRAPASSSTSSATSSVAGSGTGTSSGFNIGSASSGGGGGTTSTRISAPSPAAAAAASAFATTSGSSSGGAATAPPPLRSLAPARPPSSSSPPPPPQQRRAAAAGSGARSVVANQPSATGGFGPSDPGDVEILEFNEPSTYDADMNSRYWETRPVRVLARLVRIGLEFGGWAAASRARNLHLRDPVARDEAAAEALKDVLVRLGPAFVKIGQALSSRPDVLPPLYIAALEALQDRIPPFPDDAAMAVLESELGVPPSAVFAKLSPSPVAAASLGQVYRGVLRPELGGQEVAVKVQRPRVAQMIAQDVYILRILAGWLRTARRVNTDLPALVDEWASSLFRELNYRTEAANALRFKELYSHLPLVYVPHMYDDYTTAKVLTMEWIEGERLRTAGTSAAERQASSLLPSSSPSSPSSSSSSSFSASSAASSSSSSVAASAASRLDAQRLADLALVEVGVRCSLEQMLEEGFYHADPHPGNLLRTPDGRLAYLDFGMTGQIDERTRNALMTATLHLVNREYGRLAEDFVTLGLLPPGTDRESVLPALTGVFTDALKAGVSNLSFGTLSGNLGATMYKYSFRIPPYYTLLVRSLSVLEGIALAADPNYKVLGSAYPWIARRLLTDPSPDLRVALRRLLYSEEGSFRFDRLESLLRQAAKSANRLKRPQQPPPSAPFAGTDGTGTGSSTRSGGSALELLLSHDGEFVRGILLDEVAKGIDGGLRIAADGGVAAVRSSVAALPAPALPLLAFLPGGPLALGLLGLLAARGAAAASSAFGSTSSPPPPQEAEEDMGLPTPGSVQRSLTAALARLPSLATADDRAQVAGLLQLSNALADVAGLKLPAAVTAATSTITASTFPDSAPPPPPPPPPSAAELYDAAEQAAAAVRWLATEALELPGEAKGQLLQLPLQLGARLASRFTARTLRAAVLSGGGAGLVEVSVAAAPAEPLVPPADG